MPRLPWPKCHMPFKMRLVNRGCTNRPFFLLVVQPKPSDVFDTSTVIEQLGSFDPMPNRYGEVLCGLNIDRIMFWLGEPHTYLTKRVEKLLGLAGILPVHPMTYITARRNRLKAAAAAIAPPPATPEAVSTTTVTSGS